MVVEKHQILGINYVRITNILIENNGNKNEKMNKKCICFNTNVISSGIGKLRSTI